jgi:hypothetical protein
MRKKIGVEVKVWYFGEKEGYNAMASDGERTVWNCKGTTEEAVREMALYKLRKFQEEEANENVTNQ